MVDTLPKLALYQAELRPVGSEPEAQPSDSTISAQPSIAGELEPSGNKRHDLAQQSRNSPKVGRGAVHQAFALKGGTFDALADPTIPIADAETAFLRAHRHTSAGNKAFILLMAGKLRQRRQDRSALASWEDDGGARG